MKIYVAGPMQGIPEFNFPAFNEVARRLRDQGHTVFNPAEKANERHGTDISKGNIMGDESIAAKDHGFNLREALGLDLAWICAEADAVALLPGWENSKGAKAEKATAEALGLKVLYAVTHIPAEKLVDLISAYDIQFEDGVGISARRQAFLDH